MRNKISNTDSDIHEYWHLYFCQIPASCILVFTIMLPTVYLMRRFAWIERIMFQLLCLIKHNKRKYYFGESKILSNTEWCSRCKVYGGK